MLKLTFEPATRLFHTHVNMYMYNCGSYLSHEICTVDYRLYIFLQLMDV